MLRPLPDALHYDFTKTLKEVGQLARGRATAKSTNSHTVGLSSSGIAGETRYVAQYFKSGDSVCGGVKRLEIDYGFRNQVVYVAKEIATDACLKEAVLEHEYKHVATDLAFMPDIRRGLELRLGAAARSLTGSRARSSEQLLANFKRSLDRALSDTINELRSELSKRQAEVDTPGEYARVGRTCEGRMAGLIRRALNASLKS